ncbi:Uncharacterised protein [Burkholderia pseudomallei]|nr:outer membrane, OmpA/MotB family domain protein [Burkholderia pseudomallei MSHR640]CAJ3676017.1 Uncharacterised protein [Burkholderia pseudomallei]CAJ3687894.1 Uncharacterised protein [Burkholderia pseudomallei]CAJ3749528.1 Uncharacterised protein [Burkholderia pseudomallei]CAJ3832317.1 Uncharacterised protein [Burkholderia pseudomallei]
MPAPASGVSPPNATNGPTNQMTSATASSATNAMNDRDTRKDRNLFMSRVRVAGRGSARDRDFDAAVQRAALRGPVVADRLGAALAERLEAARGHARALEHLHDLRRALFG